jgi:hypothetical protein
MKGCMLVGRKAPVFRGGVWGRGEQELELSSNLKCDHNHKCQRYDYGHIVLCYLSRTLIFIKLTSSAQLQLKL